MQTQCRAHSVDLNANLSDFHHPNKLVSAVLADALVILCLFAFGPHSVRAAIITTGDVSAIYQGDDPWQIGGSMRIGNIGNGAILIDNTSAINVAAYGYLGYSNSSSGMATVKGAGSIWNNTDWLFIGYNGSGTLNIEEGGAVNSSSGFLGWSNGSIGKATVNGDGSSWNITGNLSVRSYGPSLLRIENGGSVTNTNGFIGNGNSSTATVTVSGAVWNNIGSLTVGYDGSGTLNIENDGLVTVGNGMRFGRWAYYAISTVNLSSGSIDLMGSALTRVAGTAQFNFTGGILKDAGSIDLDQPLLQAGGTLAPGGSIGQTDIIGDYNITAGTLEIELGGVDNPHDLVTATGNIDIAFTGTTLDLPALGAMAAGTYTVLESTGGSITGMFEQVTGIAMYAGLVDVAYTTNAVTVTLNRDFVPGDLDGDGFVGIADLNIVLSFWNQSVPDWELLSGDTDGDGLVGIADLNWVLGNWNTGTPPTTTINIPEPATSLLMAATALTLTTTRRRYPPA